MKPTLMQHEHTARRVNIKRGALGGHGLREWTSNGLWGAVRWEPETRRFTIYVLPVGGEVPHTEYIEEINVLAQRIRELGLIAPYNLLNELFDDRKPDSLRAGHDYGEIGLDADGKATVLRPPEPKRTARELLQLPPAERGETLRRSAAVAATDPEYMTMLVDLGGES